MATIKAYTDLERSKKLAKILPIESADMFYEKGIGDNYRIDFGNYADISISKKLFHIDAIPCWSLAALLSVIRETIGYTLNGDNNVYMSCDLGDKPWKLETEIYDNEVDACYEMILKLNELNLL